MFIDGLDNSPEERMERVQQRHDDTSNHGSEKTTDSIRAAEPADFAAA